MRYVVTFSLSTGRSAVHSPSCSRARRKPGYVKQEIEAESAKQAAAIYAEEGALVERGLLFPKVCKCATTNREG